LIDIIIIKIKVIINPLASPSVGAPALKYEDVNTMTPPKKMGEYF